MEHIDSASAMGATRRQHHKRLSLTPHSHAQPVLPVPLLVVPVAQVLQAMVPLAGLYCPVAQALQTPAVMPYPAVHTAAWHGMVIEPQWSLS